VGDVHISGEALPSRDPPTAVAADDRWPAGPAAPRLERGAVHAWLCDLDGHSPADVLTDAERARAEGIVREPARTRWARARCVLRVLLGLYTAGDPRELDLRTDAYGKPRLPGAAGPAFNLSHSGATALYALAADAPVGVDVEELRREIDVEALAPRALGAAMAARLAAVEDRTERQREFLRLWVQREAAAKATGRGLAERAPAPDSPWICELPIGERALGALAMAVAPAAVDCWRWPPNADGRS
jgi:4'-phosphopantetheinyl transferase